MEKIDSLRGLGRQGACRPHGKWVKMEDMELRLTCNSPREDSVPGLTSKGPMEDSV